MRPTLAILATLAAAELTSARSHPRQAGDANPFVGRQLYVNPKYTESLEATRQSFLDAGDEENAGKVQFVQGQVGSFVWISNIALLEDIEVAIENARSVQEETGQDQIVGLVLYNIPDRDCSAGESSGELSLAEGGLDRYMEEYVGPFAEKVLEASDLQFAIVVEPDAVGNMVTGGDIETCVDAAEPQQEGIAHAIEQLQGENVHLYVDVANGGWLGSEENAESAATVVASIVEKANGGKIRGFATNVSNYNPFQAETPEPFAEDSPSYDESHYVSTLSSALEGQGLPTRFIVDQGRVAVPGARESWGDWCNVEAGFGQPPTTETDNSNVDSIVWVKPGGESDGECGMEGAPAAGSWFDEYAQALTINAHPEIQPVDAQSNSTIQQSASVGSSTTQPDASVGNNTRN